MAAKMPTDLPSLLKEIKAHQSKGKFSPYIDYIIFPRYRSILPNQRIDFEFPLTVLVGRNGTGKSSVLHALYGAPLNNNVSQYWFGTAVDPVEKGAIEEVEDEDEDGVKKKLREEQKAAFWYGYRDGKIERQAIKQRVRRENASGFEQHENWEPTRPIETYGMTPVPREGKKRPRHPQIEMSVDYLNLRFVLSAFDRCFNFWSESSRKRVLGSRRWQKTRGSTQPKVQDYIRSRASWLNLAFSSNGTSYIGTAEFAKPPEQLTQRQLSIVSRIVGKTYQSGTLLSHRIYDDSWAFSIRFVTENGEYTEAGAGSGETSVVQIVRLFESANANSLLLLDEPETSLHPGAQRELLKFVLEQIWEKNLQVVISTHAPSLIKDLPREAIKVMRQQPDGLVRIEQGLSAEEAFYEIGHPFDPSCNVIVEDKLAKLILDEVGRSKSEAFAARLRVEFRPGGDSEMKKDITVFIHGNHKPVFVFDGDKKGPVDHIDPADLPAKNLTETHLGDVIKEQIGFAIKFHQDSRMSDQQKAMLRVDYLNYYRRRVMYLPFPSPEEGVWSDDVAALFLDTILVNKSKADAVMKAIGEEPDFKLKFKILTDELGQGAAHPSTLHALLVTHFIRQGGPSYEAVSALLDQVVAAAEGQ